MKVLPLVYYPLLQNAKFWLLGIAGCLIAIHLDVLWKTTENFDQVLLRALIWSLALSLSVKERNSLNLDTGRLSGVLGLIFIAWSIFRSIAARSGTDLLVINISPFVSAVGLCLLASGVRGLKQYGRELTIVFVSIVPAEFILGLLDKILGVDFTALLSTVTAKFAAFVLWYLGFEVHLQGIHLTLPGGSVAIGGPCSGMNAMILLLQIALVVIVMFPTTELYKKIFLPVSAVLVAFIVNSVRVGVLAFIVAFSNNREAFDYWHEGDGSQVFSTIAILIFCWFCQLAIQQDEAELQSSVNLSER